MRKLVPIKNSVVCKRVNKNSKIDTSRGVVLNKKDVDLYQIIDFSADEDTPFDFDIGDIVMSNSSGDELEVNKDDIYYLFKNEHIMCKVLDYDYCDR